LFAGWVVPGDLPNFRNFCKIQSSAIEGFCKRDFS
jgi:hypothetical protein